MAALLPEAACYEMRAYHQPASALSRWFIARVTERGLKSKKPAIVALARKLLVALWKHVTASVVIEGAIVQAA